MDITDYVYNNPPPERRQRMEDSGPRSPLMREKERLWLSPLAIQGVSQHIDAFRSLVGGVLQPLNGQVQVQILQSPAMIATLLDYRQDSKTKTLERIPAPSNLEEGHVNEHKIADFFYWGMLPVHASHEWDIAEELLGRPYHPDYQLATFLGLLSNPALTDEQLEPLYEKMREPLQEAGLQLANRASLALTLRGYFAHRLQELRMPKDDWD